MSAVMGNESNFTKKKHRFLRQINFGTTLAEIMHIRYILLPITSTIYCSQKLKRYSVSTMKENYGIFPVEFNVLNSMVAKLHNL